MRPTLEQRVAAEAALHPERVRPVLQVLLGEEPEHRAALRPVATALNAARRAGALAELKGGSWTSEQVGSYLARVNTRQGVHRLRERGRLWGRTIGNATYYPAWQFAGGDLRPDLPRVLSLLARFTTDVVAADRVMRLPREELGGRSIAEALDDAHHADTAWRLLAAVGGAD